MILETVIFLVAIVGIILTYVCFLDVYENEYLNSNYLITNSKNKKGENKNIQLIIKMNGYSKYEKEYIINKIMYGKFDNIEDFIDTIEIIDE